MYEKECNYISRAIKEPLELEPYEDLDTAKTYIPAALFRIRSISGNPVPQDQIILVSFNDRLPVDSEGKKRGVVDYNWRDYFGKLELRNCILKRGLFGKSHLKTRKYCKIIFTDTMWEKGEQISVVENLGMKGDGC